MPYYPGPSDGGGGGGTSRVAIQDLLLGQHEPQEQAFVAHELADVGPRALVSKFIVTASEVGEFDLEVRGGADDASELFLQAFSMSALSYVITVPWYFEADTKSIFIRIRNAVPKRRSFVLTEFRAEQFG